MNKVRLIECPRDAMQGWPHMIATEDKISYIESLLKVGFDTLDFGSFVSPKAIPQMADTVDVLKAIDKIYSTTHLLAIVANERGAREAAFFDRIRYLGFPFSVSETFQQRNTNSSREESLARVDAIQETCMQHNKQLVIYLSMGFGNPYGDAYNEDILLEWADVMVQRNINIISLADTVGMATPTAIKKALDTLIPKYPAIEFGVHLHSTAVNWQEKLEAAVDAGCKRFDGALKGIGGCPMAQDDLVGNMDSQLMTGYFESKGLLHDIDHDALARSLAIADKIFV